MGARLAALRERSGALRRRTETPGQPTHTPQEPAAAGLPQHPPASSHHEEGTT
jgi:hypothetical protein